MRWVEWEGEFESRKKGLMSLQTFSPIDFLDCKQGVFVIEHTQKAELLLTVVKPSSIRSLKNNWGEEWWTNVGVPLI